MTQKQIAWETWTPEQINALVAEKVMGLQVLRFPERCYGSLAIPEDAMLIDQDTNIIGKPANYAENWDTAWQVIRRVMQMKEPTYASPCHLFPQECRYLLNKNLDMAAWIWRVFPELTPPLVCHAALHAVRFYDCCKETP